jgi:hypothetical protein
MNPAPRVRRNALIALVQIIDIAPSSYLAYHSTTFLEAICSALREGPTIVQESCVAAIISISETNRGVVYWSKYYAGSMPIMKELLEYAQRRGLESLWSQTLEAISILGESAGKSLFYQDAMELMELLSKIQNSLTDTQNSSLESSLIKAWVRIA